MTEHADIPIGEVHIVHQWVYADASARTGASGFVSADIGKVAKQTDNDSWWVLTATTPTWAEITGTGPSGSTAFFDLTDVDPSSYSGQAANLVRVNATPDGLEFVTLTFLLPSDTPASYSGQGGNHVRVNSTPDGLEFAAPTLLEDTDTPSAFTSQEGRLLVVNQTPDAVIFEAGFAIDGSGNLNANDNQVIRPELLDYAEAVNARGTVSGAQDIDLSLGNVAELEISAATTLSLTNPPATGSYGKVRIIFHQDGTGGHTLTLPTALWDAGSAPTPSTGVDAIDIYTFFTVDAGTTWYGIVDGQAMA